MFQTAGGFYKSVWVDRGQRGEQTPGMEPLQRHKQICVAGLQYIYLELYSYGTDLGEWRYSSTYSYPYYSAKVWWIKCSLPHDLLALHQFVLVLPLKKSFRVILKQWHLFLCVQHLQGQQLIILSNVR